MHSNIGQGTLFLTNSAEVVYGTAQVSQTIANAIAGNGKLVFQGDTTLGGADQATTLTYDSVNYAGAVRIESGIVGQNLLILGDGSTAGATANTGTLGSGSIDIGRLDGDRGSDGPYAKTDLPRGQDVYSAKLRFNLSGTKIITNSALNFHAASALENTGGAAGDLTITGGVTTGTATTVELRNTSGKLTFAGNVSFGGGSRGAVVNESAADLTFKGAVTTAGRIDISNNGSGNLYLEGTVGGLVFIDQNGTGTTRLSGNNGFTGIIAVNNAAGTLEFTNSNALGAGTIRLAGGTLKLDDGAAAVNTITLANAVNIAASSTLRTADNLVFTGAFTSPAAGIVLTKDGSADLILTGNNDTFAGTFAIAEGTLQAGNGGASGTFGTKAIAFTGTDNTKAFVAVNRSDAAGVTVGNDITGEGGFKQLGTGLTILTGHNTYTGATTVSAGTLQVGNGGTVGNLGSGAVTVAAGATLSIARSDDVVLAGAIGGAGNLVQSGSGTTFLAANNIYAGTTTIAAGSLVLGDAGTAGSLGLGAVTNNGSLGFNRTDDVTVSNGISGTGTLQKESANAVTLTGPVAGQSLLVNAGTLNLTNGDALGSVTSNATLNLTAVSIGALIINAGTATVDAAVASAATVVDGNLVLTGGASKNSTISEYSGAGTLENRGAGKVTLSDTTADFTGTLKAGAGTLAFGTAAALDGATIEFNGGTVQYTGTGAIALTNALAATAGTSFLQLAGAVTWTTGAPLSGTGQIRVSGAGATALVINGVAITNGSHVVDGVTFVANTQDLGGATATATAAFVDGSSALDVTNSSATPVAFTVDQSGTAAGVVSGNLTLVKTGNSALTLTGSNTHTGGTLLSGGTLTVGNDTALGAGPLTLAGGTLTSAGARTLANAVVVSSDSAIGGTGDLTLTGAVTGSAVLTQSGSGTTTLARASGFTGAYAVSSGTLALSGHSGVFANPVSGSGTLAFTGSGVTTLAASRLNAARTLIGTGHTLDLGTDRAVAQLSSLTLDSGARLQGQGTVNALTVGAGGVFAPGNSPGIVVVTGDFSTSGTFQAEIAGLGAAGAVNGYDQVQVGGQATLGGTLAINFSNGLIAGNHSYLLVSGGNVVGGFSSVVLTQNGYVTPLTLPTGLYSIVTTGSAGLTFSTFDSLASIPGVSAPSGISGFSGALTANTAGFNAVLGTLSSGGSATSQALINASPLGLAAMTTLAVDEARATTELMRTRLDAQRRTGGNQALTTYATVTGATADAEQDEVSKGGANFDRKYAGGKVGLEKAGRGGIALGGNVGYDRGQADLLARGGKVTQDHLSASGYISHRFDATSFMYVGAFGGLSKYDAERNTVLGKAKGDTQGWDLGLSVLLGKDIALNKDFAVVPYAGLTYMRSAFDAYNESGNALALNVRDAHQDSLRTKLGSDVDWKLPTGGVKARLGLGVVWEHELLDEQIDIDASFAGSSSAFRTTAGTLAQDVIGFGPHVEVEFGDGFSARLAYQYQYGFGDETGQRVDLTVSKRF